MALLQTFTGLDDLFSDIFCESGVDRAATEA